MGASMSPKDPSYPDVKYVNALIGPGTVTTLPLQTLTAFCLCAPGLLAKLSDHRHYITTYGDDMPEVRDWTWPAQKALAT